VPASSVAPPPLLLPLAAGMPGRGDGDGDPEPAGCWSCCCEGACCWS